MKRIKEKFMVFTGVLFLTLACMLAFNPTPLIAQGGVLKFVSTTCIGAGTSFNCNRCASGTQPCFDHSCVECNPHIR